MDGYILVFDTSTLNTIDSNSGDVVDEKYGFFYVIDRMKDLIKVNGFQVSPTELVCRIIFFLSNVFQENVIMTFPRVVEVAVVGVEDELCGQFPKAFIVLEQGTDELLFRKHLEHTMKGD